MNDESSGDIDRKSRDIHAIREIVSRIGATLDLDRILGVGLEALETSLGFEHAMILLAGDDGETLFVAATRGYREPGIGATLAMGQGVFGVSARRRRITRLGNIASQRAYLENVRRQMEAAGQKVESGAAGAPPGLADAESQIGIPLVANDRLIGVLGVESRKPRAFDELDEIVLGIVANQLGQAIDNARLHKAEVARTRALDEANAELKRLNETLERSVAERTAELTRTLEEMRREKALTEDLLRRMAPPQVVPLMLADRLAARRLHVTVLFADLEGFTTFASGLEPDEVFAHLNHFFSWAGEVIERYRGYVNKTSGDGIMALFGVPYEVATHQTDAVLAGLALQQELAERFSFQMRVGINSGAVTAGMLGPRNKNLYDVLGDAVNVASRMEALCPTGRVALSPETAESVAAYFALDPLGELEVKGKGAMACLTVRAIKPLAEDRRRVDVTSLFAERCAEAVETVEALKRERLAIVDFPSLQSRDAALYHNESVAAFAVALLRALRSGGGSEAEAAADIDEAELALAALLHDVGKHALDADRLNHPSLSGEERNTLRDDMLDATVAVLERFGFAALAPAIRGLYRFESSRGAEGEYGATVEILAAADIYDALTAPKRYKGAPWRIAGALEELTRLPYCQARERAIFTAFVKLMKPKETAVRAGARPQIMLR